MIKILQRIIASIDSCNKAAFYIATFFTILLAFITAEQVLARYFLNASSVALQELEWHLFGAIFLFAAAHTFKEDNHVRVDLIYSKLSKRAQAVINCLGIMIFLVPVSYIIIIYGYAFAKQALSFQNPFPADHFSSNYFEKDSFAYQVGSLVESFLRSSLLRGEISPDSGGLEARWIIKACIPFGFVLLLFQSLAEFLRSLITIIQFRQIVE